MLSSVKGIFFGSHKPLSRFNDHTEFNQIFPLLEALDKKERQLEQEAKEKGAGSPDYLKYHVLVKIREKIKAVVDEFNRHPVHANRADETQDVLKLIDELITTLLPLLMAEKQILFTPRDNKRKIVNSLIDIVAVGGTVAAVAVTAPMPYIMVPAAFVGSSIMSHYGREVVGLSNVAPRTAWILVELLGHLILAGRNISASLGLPTGKYDLYIGQIIRICEEETQRYLNQAEESVTKDHQVESHDNELLHVYSDALKDFVRRLETKPKPSQLIEGLALTEEEKKSLADYYDVITDELIDTPVRMNGKLFDLDTTLKFPVDDKGRRKDPLSNHYMFFPRELQPDWDVANAIQERVETIISHHPESTLQKSELEPEPERSAMTTLRF